MEKTSYTFSKAWKKGRQDFFLLDFLSDGGGAALADKLEQTLPLALNVAFIPDCTSASLAGLPSTEILVDPVTLKVRLVELSLFCNMTVLLLASTEPMVQ